MDIRNISDSQRNIVFIGLLLIIVIGVFLTNYLGNKQDQIFQEDTNQYKYGLYLLKEKKITEAGQVLKPLVVKYNDNHEILRAYSIVQQYDRNYEEAAISLQKAQELNNFLIKDPTFLAQYGEVLYMIKDYKKAKVYLEEAVKLNPDKDILEAVNKLLYQIEMIEKK
ncbi:tetratricopeptide repeat protein [Calidifontibacillus erzurumensis]|uniref:Tetratricopeptide repeat protein n=1 Tax=Calidifontibacillus erzurumensis TaxID=2741433 RepID=A0A8J8KCI4_9BACI|nr:tetratricopeptide repeat protein [Calidifontibacillus erzurumensis]NSL52043.1 tetratricopeptide repeat protein [Calidifontibacillus erzurumensis]